MNTNTLPAFGVGTFRLSGQTRDRFGENPRQMWATAPSTPPKSTATKPKWGKPLPRAACRAASFSLTTKIWVDNYSPSKLADSLKESLHKLRTDAVDLTLIHWPAPGNGVALPDFMGALAEAKAQGAHPPDRRVQLQYRANPRSNRGGGQRRNRHQPN